MTTVFPDAAPVLHPLARRSVEPAPVQVCHYCLDHFTPTRDPEDESLWDVDSKGNHCCDDCYCPTCLIGHQPNETCPSAALEPVDPLADREAAMVYGDPDMAYDMRFETRCDRAD